MIFLYCSNYIHLRDNIIIITYINKYINIKYKF